MRLLQLAPSDIVFAADQALQLLEPIENWPGIARAHAAKAAALETLGDLPAASNQRSKADAAEVRARET